MNYCSLKRLNFLKLHCNSVKKLEIKNSTFLHSFTDKLETVLVDCMNIKIDFVFQFQKLLLKLT